MAKDNIISLPNLITNVTMMRLSEQVQKLEHEQRQFCEMAIKSILTALQCKDQYTHDHSTRVAYYALRLARELDLSEKEVYDVEVSALFHDIGKIGVPDSVLKKPGRLNEDEFALMKKHPEFSEQILLGLGPFKEIAKFARHHHERFDGRGYPDGLKGEQIPLPSRIILIADTFDAMTSTRPYREGLSYQVAFDELIECSGTQFDPELVNHFINAMKKEEKEKTRTFTLDVMEGEFKKDAA